ncbi:MAG TPA: 4Fe-4S binding protein, partial [Clostridia bacterium]|nr:4Fe-4S binding protein [Clostridia bacterium]
MESRRTRLFTWAAIGLLLATMVYQGMGSRQNTLDMLQGMFPAATSYQTAGGKYPAYRVYDGRQELVGYAVLAEASGYGGPLAVLVGIDAAGTVIGTEIIRHRETPLYLEMVMEQDFLAGFRGKSFADPLLPGRDLDGVSGATVSAKGIAAAVRKAVRQVGMAEFGLDPVEREPVEWGAQEFLLLALFAVVLGGVRFNLTKLRGPVMAFSVFYLGFKLGASINLGNIASLMSGNVPSFAEWPFWYLLVVGTLLLILVSGRNFYCAWLCPFGAVQEGIHKALCLWRYQVPRRYLANARRLRLILTWLALVVAFLCVNPSVAGYEPFTAFFSGRAQGGQWLLMGLVLFLSLFFNRLWCRFFCPTGAVMDLAAAVKGKLARQERRGGRQARPGYRCRDGAP